VSSNIHHVDFRARDAQILQTLLKRAHYLTSKMLPLAGPLHVPSKSVLLRSIEDAMPEMVK
jgi:hypothetical protein